MSGRKSDLTSLDEMLLFLAFLFFMQGFSFSERKHVKALSGTFYVLGMSDTVFSQ